MWAWEQQPDRRYHYLQLSQGRPTIWNRFLANVAASGCGDRILPITATGTVGMRLLPRLYNERRLSQLPDVIYLDAAHEAGETLLEVETAWATLKPGGLLMGDDYCSDWPAVMADVLSFAQARGLPLRIEGDRTWLIEKP